MAMVDQYVRPPESRMGSSPRERQLWGELVEDDIHLSLLRLGYGAGRSIELYP